MASLYFFKWSFVLFNPLGERTVHLASILSWRMGSRCAASDSWLLPKDTAWDPRRADVSWRLLWCHSLAVGGTAVSGRWDCVGLLLLWVFWVSDLVGLRRLGFGDQEESEGRGYPCIHFSTVDRLPCCFLTLSSFGLASLRVSQSDEDLAGSLSGAPKLSSKFPEMQHGPGTLRIWKAAL